MPPRTNENAPQDGRPRPDEGAPETDERGVTGSGPASVEPGPASETPGAATETPGAATERPGAGSETLGAASNAELEAKPERETAEAGPAAYSKSEDDTAEPDPAADAGAQPEQNTAEPERTPEPNTAKSDSAANTDPGSAADTEPQPKPEHDTAEPSPAAGAESGCGAGVGARPRRASESGRRRVLRLAACAVALAVAFTGFAVALGVRDGDRTVALSSSPGVSAAQLASGDLDTSVKALQAHLKEQPRDFGSWSTLGLAYVEQARTKGDPSRYPQAEKALNRSLKLRPDNDPALAGLAALAAARHEFEDALRYADRALKENPYSERALCTRIDALVELGRYDEALKAAHLADTRRPGIPVFTRYAYVYELRGDVKTARRVLEQALDSAVTRGDIAYVATQLGQLAWKQGDHKTSLDHYARALGADDTYLPALEGRARAQAASGDTAGAIRGLEQVVSAYPLPGPLVVLGELYETKGDEASARDQYALVDAYTAIARANGVNADLDTALAAADHGDEKAALRAAEAEWKRRETVHTADALAWALHVNGRDEEALPYARRATETGYRDATFLYHRGMVEYAAGEKKAAEASLGAALDLNRGFSPLGAAEARKTLKALEASK